MSLSSPVPAPSSPPARGTSRFLRPVTAVGVGLALAGVVLAYSHRPASLAVLGTLPAFSLTGHDAQPISLESLRGRPFIADFIFTTCAGLCPAMTARMLQLQKRLAPGVAIVSFTVDPEHDTPEVLARYAADFRTGPSWRFATGQREALYRLATEGFKLAAMEVPKDQQQAGGDGPFLHSAKFVLVDSVGQIRGYYDSEDSQAVERLRSDAARCEAAPFGLRDLPTLNAVLNTTSALFLLAGFVLIKAGRREAHRFAMLGALACSTIFLASYLVYHLNVGSVPFQGQGRLRSVYFTILLTHVLLAVAILPLIAMTLSRALQQRFDKHRRIARVTLPLWAYVSVTGVVVYLMLYHL